MRIRNPLVALSFVAAVLPFMAFAMHPAASAATPSVDWLRLLVRALNESNGKVIWSQNLGYVPALTCGALGIVDTATVAPAPGGGPLTVYVAGGNGYLYALEAATGKVDWKSVIAIPSLTLNDYFDWSSPTVSNGHIYVGVASACDNPLVVGGLKEYDQATGVQ